MRKKKKKKSEAKVTRWKRFDKKTKLWITHRKAVYVWWYKFLQIAIQENRKINHQFYRGWGDTSLKFDDWWKKNWQRLFAKDPIPLVQTSTQFVAPNAYRYQYNIYKLRSKEPPMPYNEIAEKMKIVGAQHIYAADKCRRHHIKARKLIDRVSKGKFP